MMSWLPFSFGASSKETKDADQPLELHQKDKNDSYYIAKSIIKSIKAKKLDKMKSILEEIKDNEENLKRVLLKEKVTRAYRENINNSPLSYACETSTKEICECLFSYIKEENNDWFIEEDVCSFTAIHWAASNQSDEILELLFTRNENFLKQHINVKGPHLSTPLHFACYNKSSQCVKWLLNKDKVDVKYDVPNANGELPLHLAAMGGDKDTFNAIFNIYEEKDREALLQIHGIHAKGMDPNNVENGDKTDELIKKEIEEICKKRGKNLGEEILNVEGGDRGVPLLFAAKELKFECMEAILSHQKLADATFRDAECDTALHFVCTGVTDKKLLDEIKNNKKEKSQEATKTQQNDNEIDAEIIKENEKETIDNYYTEKLAKILKANALLGVKNEVGNTPLDWISYDIMKKLLDKHIKKVKVQENKGDTSKKDKYNIVINNFFGHHASGSDMKNILALANSPKHGDLALHPFCQSIVSLKWQKMEKYFLLKLLFFIPLVVMLSIYSVLVVQKEPAKQNASSNDPQVFDATLLQDVWMSIYILLMIQVVFGTLSVLVLIGPFLKESKVYTGGLNKKRTMRLLEFYYTELLWSDWHEYLLWILTFLLLHNSISPILVVIIAWFTLFRVCSSHPTILPFRYILFKILMRYTKFFIFAFGLITGFGMGFYLLFHGCKSDGKSCVEGAFNGVSGMALKIPSMMMGEITYDQFPLEHAFPYVYILFTGFIFLITCCLFNMMNGLAINITDKLMAKSEIFKTIAQCEMIFEFEVLLKEVSSWIQWFGCGEIPFFSPLWIEKIEVSPSSGTCLDHKGYKLNKKIINEAKALAEETKILYENDSDDESETGDGNNDGPLILIDNAPDFNTLAVNTENNLISSSRASSLGSIIDAEIAEEKPLSPKS